MVLVDTSVWIAHFRKTQTELVKLLAVGLVCMHPQVRGELACGNLRERTAALSDLASLPKAPHVADAEVMHLIEVRRLWGRGLGWIDMHLLAAAMIGECRLWSLDRRLQDVAAELGVGASVH